ncbi:MAG: cytochrome c biogenesis protein ResB [Candidatus Coatesbacteria bacterium]|nr:MAG: cytochrome c biogenesis protein ResB [Candidatus Coatesbacteria bacterium]
MKKVFDVLSSRRVAVYLFLVLLFVSLLGALIPQNELPAYYETHYRPWAVTLLKVFQLTDLYHAWYFIFILLFLMASLATCTIRRLPRLTRLFRRPELPASYGDLALREEIGPASAWEEVERKARRLGFRWRDFGDVRYGRRRPYAVAGEILTHLGLIVIFVGAFLRPFGHRETVFLFEGQGFALPAAYGAGYELWADAVEEIRDPDSGRVMEYRTRARLVREGEEVASAEVEVNGPLRYGGLGVYQSNMDPRGVGLAVEAVKLDAGTDLAEINAARFMWAVGGTRGEVAAAPGETVALGDTGYQLRFLESYERFVTDERGFRNDNPEYNPAAFVNVLGPSGGVAMGILFELYPEFSVLRSEAPDFAGTPVTVMFNSGGGDGDRGERREYLALVGSNVVVGEAGDRMEVELAGGGVPAHGVEMPLAARITRADGDRAELTLPPGEWVEAALSDGTYAVRFAGLRRGAMTGLTLARDPGLGAFYAGCLLLSLGVAVAMLLSYDELFLYRSGGKIYLAGRSSKGARWARPAFERHASKLRERS